MKANDIIEFAKIMVVLSEVYGDGKPPSDIKNEVYFSALKNYEIDTIKNAAERMIINRVYPSFPKPAEIIQEIEGTKENQATQAWIKTVEAIRHYGNYTSVKFDDPVIHGVIEFMGGWPETGLWTDEELKWKQREFERLYGIIQARGKNPEYLPGIVEISNTSKGYDKQEGVVMIGNFEPERLRLVR